MECFTLAANFLEAERAPSLILFCANIHWISTCIRQTDCIHMTTSYCLPQSQECCDMQKMMSTVQHNCKNTEQQTEKTWGRGFSNEHNMAEHFNHFLMKKQANYWLKTQQKQQEDNLTDDVCYLENICSSENHFFA